MRSVPAEATRGRIRNGTLVGLLSLDDLAFEAARPLRGGVNAKLRDLVLQVHLSIDQDVVRAVRRACLKTNQLAGDWRERPEVIV